MITVSESGLSAPNYALMSDPLEHKTLKLEATNWEPIWETAPAPSWGAGGNVPYSLVRYDNKLWGVRFDDIGYYNGSDWVFVKNFNAPVGMFTTHVSLSTDGTALYAIATCYDPNVIGSASSGIYACHKTSPGAAFTSVTKVASLPSTTTAYEVTRTIPTFTSVTGGTPDGAHPGSHAMDNTASSYWSHSGPVGNNGLRLQFTTSPAATFSSIFIKVREWTDIKMKRRAPRDMVLQVNTGTWTDVLTIPSQTDWQPGEEREFYFSYTTAGVTSWRLVVKGMNGTNIVEIAEISFGTRSVRTRFTWTSVASPPYNPTVVFACFYDGASDLYHVERITRSAANLATWTRSSFVQGAADPTNTGELVFPFPVYLLAASKTDPMGQVEFGVMCITQQYAFREEVIENGSLNYYNRFNTVFKFFTMKNLPANTGTDSFSDGVDVISGEWFTDNNSVFNIWISVSGNAPVHLTEINNRWVLFLSGDTNIDNIDPTYSEFAQVLQSADGVNWSLPTTFASVATSPASLSGTCEIFGDYLYAFMSYGVLRTPKPPLLGYTPTYIDITQWIAKSGYSGSQLVQGSVELDNSTGFFDAHATLTRRGRWLMKLSAKVHNGGATMQIALGLSEAKTYDDAQASRRVTVNFSDFMVLMNGKYTSDEFHYRNPVVGVPPRDRDSKYRQVIGEWTIDQPSGLLRSTSANGIALRVDSAEVINGSIQVNGSASFRRVVRGIDENSYMTIEGPSGVNETFTAKVYLNGQLFSTATADANLTNTMAFCRIVVRYCAVYVLVSDIAGGQRSVRFYPGFTMRPYRFIGYTGNQRQDGLHQGSFGYAATVADDTFSLDHVSINGPIVTIEDTVRFIAAKSNIFDVKTINTFASIVGAGGWNAGTVSLITNDQWDKVLSYTVNAGALNTWTRPETSPEKVFEFYLQPMASGNHRSWICYNAGNFQCLVEFNNSSAAGGWCQIYDIRQYNGVAATVRSSRRLNVNSAARPKVRISFSRYKHITVLGKNADDTDAYTWYYVVSVHVNDAELITYAETPTITSGTTVLPIQEIPDTGDVLSLQGVTSAAVFHYPKVSSLDRLSDPITIDPGEAPWPAFSRVTEGLRIRTAMRYNGAIAAFAYGDTKSRGLVDTIAKSDRLEGYRTSYNSDLPNDIRMNGAYVEGRMKDAKAISQYGHRFSLASNPYMYTISETKEEAERVLEDNRSLAEAHEFTVHFLPTLEIEDHITVYDQSNAAQTIVVDNLNVTMDPTTVKMTVVGRKSSL